ncbi:helix-turn-helix domain-containing protein [Novosphingobium sp.]|jgi:excisionase family DNA binding protein|uniref:helix-turn-helix domain-containing protein n=1 Tax=Novosphingobium sp. TaxID=1874826 RepID=UPI002FE2D7FA
MMDEERARATSSKHVHQPLTEPLAVRIPEACRLTGIGRSKLYQMIARGDIETIKVGAITLVPMRTLRRLIERP